MKRTAAQFGRYVSVALASAGSDWLVFAALHETLGLVQPAQVVARLVGGAVSFALNRVWAFGGHGHRRLQAEAIRFIVLYVLSFGLAVGLLAVLHDGLGMSAYLAKGLTDAACFLFNFAMMKFFVFPARPGRPQSGQGADRTRQDPAGMTDQPAPAIPLRADP